MFLLDYAKATDNVRHKTLFQILDKLDLFGKSI